MRLRTGRPTVDGLPHRRRNVVVDRESRPLFGFWLTLLVNDNRYPSPLFFISVDSKRLRVRNSCMEE